MIQENLKNVKKIFTDDRCIDIMVYWDVEIFIYQFCSKPEVVPIFGNCSFF